MKNRNMIFLLEPIFLHPPSKPLSFEGGILKNLWAITQKSVVPLRHTNNGTPANGVLEF